MSDLLVRSHVTIHAALLHATHRARRAHHDERGEGVISAAIAVLIMAFLGASMWVLFNQVFQDTNAKTQNQVEQIGR